MPAREWLGLTLGLEVRARASVDGAHARVSAARRRGRTRLYARFAEAHAHEGA